jgi:hypothetical protein
LQEVVMLEEVGFAEWKSKKRLLNMGRDRRESIKHSWKSKQIPVLDSQA